MAPILESGLPLSGICRTFPRALVYGSLKHLGLGLRNIFTTQGLRQVAAVLDHVWKGTDTGTLIRTSVEHAKLESGTPGSLFPLDFKNFRHLYKDTWVKHVWYFITMKGIQIEDNLGDFLPLRDKDKPLSLYFQLAYSQGLITLY